MKKLRAKSSAAEGGGGGSARSAETEGADCEAGGWDNDGRSRANDVSRSHRRRAAGGWPLGTELLDAACKGRKPQQTFYAEYDVDKFVKQARK